MAAHELHSPVVQSLLERARNLDPPTSLEIRLFAPRPTWRRGANPPDALGEIGVRALTMLLSLVPDDAPSSVRAVTAGAITATERARLELRLTSGAVAHVEVGWQDRAIEDVQLSSERDVLRAEITPDQRLEHNGEAMPNPVRSARGVLHELGYVGQLQAVVERSPTRPLPAAEVGAVALQWSTLARHAAATGTTIAWTSASHLDR
jgi:predicted dehydrogenase